MNLRNLVFMLLLLLGSTVSYAQVGTVDIQRPEDSLQIPELIENAPADSEKVFMYVEQMPEFPGGEAALMTYILKNVKYPEEAIKNHTQGKVWVTFVVAKDGSIRDARVLRELGNGCSDEALRVVKNMPKWEPGKQNGKAVNTQFTIPVNFALSDDR